MWKSNWNESRQRLTDWWNRKGLVLGMWGAVPLDGPPHDRITPPKPPLSIIDAYTNARYRSMKNHANLARQDFPADILPIADTDLGPGSLALFLGSTPTFSEETVWFFPSIHDCSNPEDLPPLVFNPENKWWKLTQHLLKTCVQQSSGQYLVGCPDLIENIDILASLRDAQNLMTDMIERPEWVEQKVAEINEVWFEAYQRIYNIIALEDGSSAYGAFSLWGLGKTAKVQCDASAMISPRMFRRFVLPALEEQCAWLDHTLYHLDGTQALCHLDSLLEIETLDAIEWTPQAGIEGGGHPRWYPLYKKILDARKSVQIVGVSKTELEPLLEAIGNQGVYILTSFSNTREVEEYEEIIDRYR